MNKKVFLLGLALLVAGQFLAAQVFQIITLSADGEETTYALSSVQKIIFENNTMTIDMKTGDDVTNITRLSFAQDFSEDNVDIENPDVAVVFVFPNPVENYLTVTGVNKNVKINLLDINGNLLQSIITQDNITDVDVSSLQKGIYLLQIGEQVVKFIKK